MFDAVEVRHQVSNFAAVVLIARGIWVGWRWGSYEKSLTSLLHWFFAVCAALFCLPALFGSANNEERLLFVAVGVVIAWFVQLVGVVIGWVAKSAYGLVARFAGW